MQAQDALLAIEKTTSISLAYLIEQMGLALRSGGRAEADSSSASVTDNCAAFSIGADDLAVLTRRPHWRVRRALDFIAALGPVIVLGPLMRFVAILSAIDVGLPVTFCQQRPGLGGQPFKLHKIRTMAAAHDSRGRRVADEERTSGIGRFLRRTRLDEL